MMASEFYVKVAIKLNSDYYRILLNKVYEKQIINIYLMAHRLVLTTKGLS